MARRTPQRPGLPQVSQLPQAERLVMEPIIDLLSRVLGISGLGKVKTLEVFATADVGVILAGAATLADVITQVNILTVAVNELQTRHNDTQMKLNELISRIQED